MKTNRCVIIGASPDSKTDDLKRLITSDDFVVCAPGTGIGACGMGTTLIKGGVPREGQLARGIRFASQHGGNRLASLRADEPSL